MGPRLGPLLRAFGRPRADRDAIARIKTWTLAALGNDEAGLAVNEIVCPDPACPGWETVILIMEPGCRTRAVKVGKALAEVTEQDIRAVLV